MIYEINFQLKFFLITAIICIFRTILYHFMVFVIVFVTNF